MEELNDLFNIVEHKTGASPIVARFLLSIASLSAEININTLLTKVSSNYIEKIFNIIVAMKSSTEMYFHVVEHIQKNKKFLNNVSIMEGL